MIFVINARIFLHLIQNDKKVERASIFTYSMYKLDFQRFEYVPNNNDNA